MTRLNTQHIKAMGSSARCGTSLSIGPTSTGAKATHSAPPDIRLHRTDSLVCSHTGLLRASPENRLPRRTHSSMASPDPLASPDNRLPRRTHSSTASLGHLASPENRLPRRTHSSTASSDHHTSPDNRLPRRTHSPASLTRLLLNSGQPAAQDGLTRQQFHQINLRIFAE